MQRDLLGMKINSVSDCKEPLVVKPSLLTIHTGHLYSKAAVVGRSGDRRKGCTSQVKGFKHQGRILAFSRHLRCLNVEKQAAKKQASQPFQQNQPKMGLDVSELTLLGYYFRLGSHF